MGPLCDPCKGVEARLCFQLWCTLQRSIHAACVVNLPQANCCALPFSKVFATFVSRAGNGVQGAGLV